uniref:C2 domain-containing protein n=1 Tax=Strigamia maritima TaxID=126957 RepID=T1JKN2_STRMM
MSIEVFVTNAKNLPNVEKFGKSDPYVTISIQGIKRKTEVKESTLDPIWNENLVFDLAGKLPKPDEMIDIVVKDYERIGRNRLLGSATLSLRNFLSGPKEMEIELHLVDKNQQPTPAVLYLKISYKIDPQQETPVTVPSTQLPLSGPQLVPEVQPSDETPGLSSRPGRLHREMTTKPDKFQLNAANVYAQPAHSYTNKWLVISDSNDLSHGVTGYLKVSVAILGPGDEAPNFNGKSINEVDDDIESNLLWPVGLQLRPATFSLEVFHAEDLPRMDSEVVQEIKKLLHFGKAHKELVDPYLIFSYAGKELQTKIMYNSDHPLWNTRLKIGFMFPSVCNHVTLTLKDWDRLTDDDTIATSHILMPEISAAGENGFLPSFGPCFVSFYGSPREFATLGYEYDEELNTAKVEGCAYRGRVLINLRTSLGDYPSVPFAPIEEIDVWRVENFSRRRRFNLNAVLIDATMVSETNSSVEFEISIGNYGNKFESTTMPSPSTSQPTNAVYDGCKYFFLPWTEAKPFINVPCQWEDISFRLECLNILESALYTLKKNLEKLKTAIAAKEIKSDLIGSCIDMINQLIFDCSISLPEPIPGSHPRNELDILLSDMRKFELNNLVQMASDLRENITDINNVIKRTEDFINILTQIAIEPQNSIPDVIVWMMSNKKRIAYKRIPVHHIFFSPIEGASGKYCGKLRTLILKVPGKKQPQNIPAMIRLRLWFSLDKFNSKWLDLEKNAEVAVFAETYENQVSILGKWTTKGPTMTRPPFSDAAGIISLPKDYFTAPDGWKFDGDWFVAPEISAMYDSDAGHRVFLEDVFENQNRLPAGKWISAITLWTDVRGDPAVARDSIVCPDNWEWESVWKYDTNRAVDEEGWEYTLEATFGGYSPVEKTYHLCRRRRWVRQRRLVKETKPTKKLMHANNEGWEYAGLFFMRFHSIERTVDLVRRKRWHRKMIRIDDNKDPVFHLGSEKKDSKVGEDVSTLVTMNSPRFFLIYNESHKYQLRVYIYQARNLLAGDKTGLSGRITHNLNSKFVIIIFVDPFAAVIFLSRSQTTDKVHQTLCPIWDQSLIFEDITMYGNCEDITDRPPYVYLEIYDHDAYGEPDYLGRTRLAPVVHLRSDSAFSTKLAWYQIQRGNEDGGEILAAAELYLTAHEELPFLPPKINNKFMVPNGIRPVLQKTIIEVLCWGLRNLKSFEFSNVNNPSIEIECGNKVLQTKYLKNIKTNPNFEKPLMKIEMMLPKEELFRPPINMKLRDHRSFGRCPIIGTSVIKGLQDFQFAPSSLQLETGALQQSMISENTYIDIDVVDSSQLQIDVGKEDKNIDWWSKYYASVDEFEKCLTYVEKGFDILEVFPMELERVERFQQFQDFLKTFPFIKNKGNSEKEPDSVIGELKGAFRIYSISEDSPTEIPKSCQNLPNSKPEEVIVRAYFISAQDLAPKDLNSLADPYVEIKIGKKKLSSRKNYKPNTLNPIFGEMFEMTAILPIDKELRIRVYDYDHFNKDDLIGETTIDLENRLLTRFRATCGLPKKYHTSGPNVWRDSLPPTKLLAEVCRIHQLPKPEFQGSTKLIIGSSTFLLKDFEKSESLNRYLGSPKERLALHYLNSMALVPEHVETRRLFNPSLPELEQGKLLMWVDIFPKSAGNPGPPVSIQPRIPSKYVLRCVIYNTVDVILQEENILGEKMSDIYVKGWIYGVNKMQKTDVHYRSLDGEGNFNWRFVFNFDYLPSEQMLVAQNKDHIWSMDKRETRLLPKLCLQIWDNDKFSFDDFLGEIELNLVNLLPPFKSAKTTNLDGKITRENTINLFDKKRVYGFWPCHNNARDGNELTGKLEMELELLTEEEAKQRPAGHARDEPNINPHLEKPKVTKTCSRLLFKAACEICIFLITATINQIGGISLPEILVESLWPLFRTTADDFQGGGDGMWNPE